MNPRRFVHRAMLSLAALLVPRRDRREWWTEWMTELWYLAQADRRATRFCLGAFQDAFLLRLEAPRSPVWPLVLLASLAVMNTLFAFRLPGVITAIQQPPIFAHVLMVLVAFLLLRITTSLDLGDYPAGTLRWLYLGAKFALIIPAVFFGTFALIPIIAPAGMLPQAALLGYVLAFRWALLDQRRRCPVCLRVLDNPVHIGQASHIFLEWYGTELVCSAGHGLLHVTETPTISCRTQRWLTLDPSWRSLFL